MQLETVITPAMPSPTGNKSDLLISISLTHIAKNDTITIIFKTNVWLNKGGDHKRSGYVQYVPVI